MWIERIAYPKLGQYDLVPQSQEDASSKPSPWKSYIFHQWNLCIVGIITLVCLGLLFFFAVSQKRSSGEFTLVPKIETIPVDFNPDLRYWNFSDYSSEQHWRQLGRNGNIYISQPERFSLLPGIDSSTGAQGFPVSVFHQLHCLRIIRDSYAALYSGWAADDNSAHHPDHCFDYLRQAIMCSGDMTLEHARVEEDGSRRATEGWGVTHSCKSWSAIETFMEENRWKNVI